MTRRQRKSKNLKASRHTRISNGHIQTSNGNTIVYGSNNTIVNNPPATLPEQKKSLGIIGRIIGAIGGTALVGFIKRAA